MPRHVRVVLCTAAGQLLGELPELVVEPQWWPEVAPVVAAVRSTFGAEISVLRLLESDGPSAEMGGSVSYLAELLTGAAPSALLPTPYAGELSATADHPLRAAWARPGAVAATIEWADGILGDLGRPRTGPAVHQSPGTSRHWCGCPRPRARCGASPCRRSSATRARSCR